MCLSIVSIKIACCMYLDSGEQKVLSHKKIDSECTFVSLLWVIMNEQNSHCLFCNGRWLHYECHRRFLYRCLAKCERTIKHGTWYIETCFVDLAMHGKYKDLVVRILGCIPLHKIWGYLYIWIVNAELVIFKIIAHTTACTVCSIRVVCDCKNWMHLYYEVHNNKVHWTILLYIYTIDNHGVHCVSTQRCMFALLEYAATSKCLWGNELNFKCSLLCYSYLFPCIKDYAVHLKDFNNII